jgi:uncharacterized membrane protein
MTPPEPGTASEDPAEGPTEASDAPPEPAGAGDRPADEPVSRREGTLAAVAYAFGALSAAVVWLLERESAFVRFHATQSAVFTVAVLLLVVALSLLQVGLVFLPGVAEALSVLFSFVYVPVAILVLIAGSDSYYVPGAERPTACRSSVRSRTAGHRDSHQVVGTPWLPVAPLCRRPRGPLRPATVLDVGEVRGEVGGREHANEVRRYRGTGQ